MKKTLTFFTILFLFNFSFCQDMQIDQTEVLTNDAIINMVNSKMSKKIILTKIASTAANFDLTSTAIINLYEKNINDELILKMMESDKNRMIDNEILTNEVIIKMNTAKISKKIILSKIKSSNNNYDLKTDALIKLKENKVSEDIVMAIMDAKSVQVAQQTRQDVKRIPKKFNKPTDLSRLNAPGIYYYDGNTNSFTKLDANVFSQTKTNKAAQVLVSSMINAKGKSMVNGSNANLQLNDYEISFYFYFSKQAVKSKEIENELTEFSQSPNEFTLAKFKTYPDKNFREMELSKSSALGGTSGMNESQLVNFKYEKINDNLFRVYFPKPLVNGEYCFMPTINSSSQGNAAKMYDFGVKSE